MTQATQETQANTYPTAVSAIRSDGKEKVMGTGRYTADLTLTGQPQFLFREWQGPFFIQWLVVLGYFYTGFVRPFLRSEEHTSELQSQ